MIISVFEAMKASTLGKIGHIAMGTNHIERAMKFLELKGVEFDLDTAKFHTIRKYNKLCKRIHYYAVSSYCKLDYVPLIKHRDVHSLEHPVF
jgi:hypothetical protein